MDTVTKVYVDSSFRAKDGMCQSGCVFHDSVLGKQVSFSSDVFEAYNNNDSEILGFYYVLKRIYEKYDITNFKVINDNIVACSMLDGHKKITKKVLKEHPVLEFVIEYFKEHDINVKTEQVGRSHKMMKKCDKLSKAFRHKGGKNDNQRI